MKIMKMQKKTRLLFALVINLFIVVSASIITVNGVVHGPGEGQLGDGLKGGMYFMPYTIDSNVLLALSSIVISVFLILSLIKEEKSLPRAALIFRFIASSTTTLTFVTVLFFLAPMQLIKGDSFFVMFRRDMFFFHFLNPVLSLVSLLFFERPKNFSYKVCFLTLIPTVIYSWVYFFNVMVFENWIDIYGFSFGGLMWVIPIVFVVMYSSHYLASFIIALILKKVNSKGVYNENN